MTATVLVLGHRGMLGHVVARHLAERGFRVTTIASRFDAGREVEFLADVAAAGASAVVNCIGVRASRDFAADLFRVNALLPQLLAAGGRERLLVHASTDGVFAPSGGPFPVSRPPDATDAYGLSKRLGELCVEVGRSVVLRTSLVGPERETSRSLLGWLSSQRGEVPGYTDQLWNGITTLSWAKLCERALRGELPEGVHQPAAATAVTKHELVATLVKAFGFELSVRAVESGGAVDRRLVPTVSMPPIREQLDELRSWYGEKR